MSLYKVIVIGPDKPKGTTYPMGELFTVQFEPEGWATPDTEMMGVSDVLCYVELHKDGTVKRSWSPMPDANGKRVSRGGSGGIYDTLRGHVQYHVNKRVHAAFNHTSKTPAVINHALIALIAENRGIGESVDSMIATYVSWVLEDRANGKGDPFAPLPATDALRTAFNTRVIAEIQAS